MDHRPLPRPRLTPSAGPFHVQGGFMWLNIITGAVMLATQAYMDLMWWIYIG